MERQRDRKWDEDTPDALAEHAPAVISYDDERERAVQPESELRHVGDGDGHGEGEPTPPAAPEENEAGERPAPGPLFYFHADETWICVWRGRRSGGQPVR